MRKALSCLLVLATAASLGLANSSAALAAPPPDQNPNKAKADVFNATQARQGDRSSGPGKRARSSDAGREVAGMRSQNSKTVATNAGYVTEVFANAINFQDAKGNWQAIDDTLVPSGTQGFAVRNKANAYTVLLPQSLASPVRFSFGGGDVEFTLAGGGGSIATKGQTATYANALPNTSVSFDSGPQGLKERLSLQNAQAPSSFNYSLKLPAGWSARANNAGGLDLLDSGGKLTARIPALFMFDSAKRPAYSQAISMTLNGQTLTVTADKTWLSDAARVYPVTIDPSILTNLNYYGPHDCYLQNTAPTASTCSSQGTYAGATDPLGFDGTNVDRDIYWFGATTSRYGHPVPNSNILDAELDITLASSSSTSAVPVTVYPITQAWDDAGASWNNANTGVSWTMPGGTVGSAITTVNVGPSAGSVAVYNLTSTIQNWVNGNSTDNGLLLRAANESAAGLLQIDNQNFGTSSTDPSRPHLRIQWNGWGGLQPWFKFDGQKQIDDRMSIAVNVANGQLVVHNQDLHVSGIGLDLSVDRYYNSLSDIQWHLGTGWNLNAGCDVRIDLDDHDGVSFWSPDGYQVLYRNNGSGGYITPPGINADLVKNGDGTFTLTYRGSNLKYNFQSGGCLQNETDRNGNQISMSYNGSLQTITDTENRATTLSYNSSFSSDFITKITDSASRTYQYGYDGSGNLTSYTDANGKLTSYAYNSNNQLSQVKDPDGNIVNFTYSTTYPQPLTQISYVNSSCTGGACNTGSAYNSGAGPCTSSGIWMNTVVTDANGHTTTYCYDNQGRVLEIRDANNNKTSLSYTANNNVASFTDPTSTSTNYSYDSNFNLTQIQRSPSGPGQTGASANWTYQAPGQTYLPSSGVDPQGNCGAFTYDSSGNLTNVYGGQAAGCDGRTGGTNTCSAYQGDPSGTCGATSTVSCTNAHQGQLCWTQDGKGNRTSYAYDTNHNPASVTPPSPLSATTITVDSLSRVSTVTDGKGQKTTYSYDTLDRVTQILFGGATTCSSGSTCTTIQYDPDGNPTSRTDATGSTTFTYDTMNRLTKKALPSSTWNCSGQGGLTMTYDGVGNLTSYCDAGGTVTYTYDTVNRVQNLAEPGGSCSGTVSLCSTFAYDNGNRLTKLTFPGGATENVSYDGSGNETSAVGKDASGNVLTSFSYSYSSGTSDRALRLSMTEADALANLTTTYTYDAFNRLTQSANSQTTLTYGYDAAGNRTSDTSGSYVYNAANEMTSSPGVASYGYDADGNLTSRSTGGSFTYNAQNQTTAATWGGQTLSGQQYAGLGQAERTAAGSTSFASSPLGLQVSQSSGSNTYFTRDGRGNLLGQRLPDGSHWYFLKDGLGSVVAVINGAGTTVANRYGYDPYGKTTIATGSQANPWRYAGGYLDATGLIKFGTRYYDSNLGRFTQADPAVSMPVYAYAGNNPISNADPTGLWCAGVGYGFTAFAGIGLWGIAALGSVEETYCSGSGFNTIANAGGAAGPGVAAGGFAGAGEVGFFSPDASTVSQLVGPFTTADVCAGRGPSACVEGSTGSANVLTVSGPAWPLPSIGYGFGAEVLPTYTSLVF